MKNIKNKIINSYNVNQLDELKAKIGIVNQEVYVSQRSRLFVPSLVSLFSSIILVVIATVLFLNPKPSDPSGSNGGPDTTDSTKTIAIENLKQNTNKYIDVPIKTLFDTTNGTIISIYYGITEKENNTYKNYLLILYETNGAISFDTKIIDLYGDKSEDVESIEDQFIFDQSSIVNGIKTENLEVVTTDLLIEFIIEENEYSINISLEEYYNFLTK